MAPITDSIICCESRNTSTQWSDEFPLAFPVSEYSVYAWTANLYRQSLSTRFWSLSSLHLELAGGT